MAEGPPKKNLSSKPKKQHKTQTSVTKGGLPHKNKKQMASDKTKTPTGKQKPTTQLVTRSYKPQKGEAIQEISKPKTCPTRTKSSASKREETAVTTDAEITVKVCIFNLLTALYLSFTGNSGKNRRV